jgi:outer membrane protein
MGDHKSNQQFDTRVFRPLPRSLFPNLRKTARTVPMKGPRLSPRGLWKWAVILLSCLLGLAGCAHGVDDRSLEEWVAPAADHIWQPAPETAAGPQPAARVPDIPPDLLQPGKKWHLADIIEVALRNNPQTRSTWYAARAAAADWLSQKGAYYPQIDADASLSHSEVLVSPQKSGRSLTSFEPGLELTWLLLDFGGREASVEEKRQALLAADFAHNDTIQQAVLLVLQTYFQYSNSKALVTASEASLKEAQVLLEAAEERHQNGLATIADVLQAKTALSQAQLNLDALRGQVQTIRGALATAMGLAANTAYDIEDLPVDLPPRRVSEAVEAYIQQAQANRPDLAAQRSRVEQAQSHIRTLRSQLYPSLVVDNRLSGIIDDQSYDWHTGNTTALLLKIPLFKGYSRRYDVLKAEQEAESEKAQLESLQQTIILEVWSSYFNLQTSEQRVHTSADLLESAQQSYDVSLGRYKEGVGGFLDLLAAQSTLERARAQRVAALSDWYISFAQLARDSGKLWNEAPGVTGGLLDGFPTTTLKERQP